MGIPAKNQERFHFLDGFRGIAISMVVFAHAFLSQIVKVFDHFNVHILAEFFKDFISSGLDLFFVLSGMVILRPYLRKERPFKAVSYFRRRMIRLYPPFFFALLFGALVVWINNIFPTWYNADGMRMQFSWYELLKEALIINFDGNYYNLAWWSLNIEIVFYVLAPFIVYFFLPAQKITDRKLWTTIFVSLIITVLLQFWFTYHLPLVYSFEHLISNAGLFLDFPICFLMGAFLAAKDFSIKYAYRFMLLGGILFIASAFYIPALHQRYYPMAHTGYGIFSAGLIVLGFNNKPFRDFWSKPILVWLGERSYSLYLIHFSVFYLVDSVVSQFTPGRNLTYGILTRLASIPLSFFASMLLFHFVERKYTHGLVTDKIFWPWQIRRFKN